MAGEENKRVTRKFVDDTETPSLLAGPGERPIAAALATSNQPGERSPSRDRQRTGRTRLAHVAQVTLAPRLGVAGATQTAESQAGSSGLVNVGMSSAIRAAAPQASTMQPRRSPVSAALGVEG